MPSNLEHIDKTIKILVVDDQAPTRQLVRSILRSIGFSEIAQAENGQLAIEYINHNDVGLVICDWNMPLVTGLEVLKAVRSIESLKRIPFIMLTAEAYRESLAAAVQAGVTDYISKPFTAETLISKISGVFKK